MNGSIVSHLLRGYSGRDGFVSTPEPRSMLWYQGPSRWMMRRSASVSVSSIAFIFGVANRMLWATFVEVLKRRVRTLVITGVLVVCAVANTLAQQRWYQLYDEGVSAFRRQQWDVAEARFKAALAANPKQGRQVFFYGTRRDDYLPEYYLAQLYLRNGRGTDAAPLIDRIEKDGLIKRGDREFAEFDRISTQVRALARSNPTDAGPARGGPLTQTQAPVDQNPVPGRGNSGSVTTNPVTTNPVNGNVANADTTTARGALSPGAGPSADASTVANPDAAGTNRSAPAGTDRSVPRVRTTIPPTRPLTRPTSSPYAPGLSVLPTTTTIAELERRALSTFYRGDYKGAMSVLESADYQKLAATSDPSGRKRLFYLACSTAAVALTEAGPADRLAQARAQFVAAQGNGPQFAEDRRYISPKILNTLAAAGR